MLAHPSALRPEFEFLCCIAHPRLPLECARALLAAGLDFDELTRLAAQHAIRPLLLKAFASLGWQNVPAPVREGLERFAQTHRLRSLSFAEELCRVSRALQEAGVPFAAFKGIVLASALYGDPAGREYLDIDIVVPADRVVELRSELQPRHVLQSHERAVGDPGLHAVGGLGVAVRSIGFAWHVDGNDVARVLRQQLVDVAVAQHVVRWRSHLIERKRGGEAERGEGFKARHPYRLASRMAGWPDHRCGRRQESEQGAVSGSE